MTDGKSSGGTGLLKSPGANKLVEELGAYAEARLEHMLTGVGHKMGDAANRLGSAHVGPGPLVHVLGKGGKLLGGQIASQAKETAAHAKDAVTDKIKGATGLKHGPSHGGGAKSITIIEDIDVGVPVREAYNQWTQFTEFGRFTKGVVSVEQKDDTTTQWQVKIAKASRAFTGTIVEQVPDERIAWTSEGTKGTTRGVVTFHPVAENLTKVLLVLDYYPKGLVEKTANVWRAQGRRTRLDLKLFRKFVTLRGEATGAWRGEIREGEVVRGPEEEAEEERREARGEEKERPRDKEDKEKKEKKEKDERDEEEYEEQPEDRYDERDEDEEADEDEGEEEDEEEEDEEPEDRYEEEEPADESRRRRR
ncbi:SRPBCC family protein [Streptomyces sp. PSKA30]|uniref:SRPBCC family protein n=1 Tax=Streptomyces sp. PSKA30 TaxID=2874597 RepID=UPI001CD1666E|nr:SRPBCC family protein [Streptomyces sp. PSKA30]MBZ9642041.1 SRPBCC family protein [Streptomyces sp. PSKA30]